MKSLVLLVSGFISTIFFPWFLTILFVLTLAFVEPLGAIAVGLFADTLYYSPSLAIVPLYTLASLILCLVAMFVRSRLRAGIIRG